MNAMRLTGSAPSLRQHTITAPVPAWRHPGHVVLETCVEDVEGVRISARVGADRAELGANLTAAGTTPSIGTIEAAIFAAAEQVEQRRAQAGAHWAEKPEAAAPFGLRILIRPRGGSFVYNADEGRAMIADVRRIATLALEMAEFTRPQATGGGRTTLPPAVDLGFVVGALTRQRATGLPLWWIPLAVLWIVGYCLFAQTVTWIKTPARRRAGLRTPILTSPAVCAASGLAILALHGLCLAVWLVGFVPLVVVALALVRNHEERSVTSGMTTVAAACLMFYVLRCGGWPPLAPGLHDGLTGLLLYGYFAGTVLHVKSLIRERNDPAAARNSVLWHAAWFAAAVVLCGPWLGTGSPWWIVFFAVALARTTAMKRLQDNGLTFRPGTLGVVEIALSAAAIACGLA